MQVVYEAIRDIAAGEELLLGLREPLQLQDMLGENTAEDRSDRETGRWKSKNFSHLLFIRLYDSETIRIESGLVHTLLAATEKPRTRDERQVLDRRTGNPGVDRHRYKTPGVKRDW